MMKKLLILFTLVLLQLSASSQVSLLYFEKDELIELKKNIKVQPELYEQYLDQLKSMIEKIKDDGPWSVTYASPDFVKKGSHDYVSESPYWWPDPENPGGPYIKKDGQRNPDRFLDHKEMILRMYQKASLFSIAAYLFDSEEYAKLAEEVLNVWFVNEDTKMNPHLKYAQLIKGHTRKRGVGIIETHRFTRLIESLHILKLSGYWSDESYTGVKNWFDEFSNWLRSSDYGIDEKERGNNHSSWYASQLAAFAVFTGDDYYLGELVEYVKESLIPNQIDSNGSMPLEEARTLSLSYSTFNLDALSTFAAIADNYNYDLWSYKRDGSGSIIDAIERVAYFIERPGEWNKEQIKPLDEEPPLFLALYGLEKQDEEMIELFYDKMGDKKFKTNSYVSDPFDILLSMYIINFKKGKDKK